MKTFIAVLLIATGGFSTAGAAEAGAKAAATSAGVSHTDRLPGVDLAEGVSQITGAGISPLLGVSAVGAWRYYHTPAASRATLPWFCHPAVWGVGFGLLAICLIKDVFGTVAPPLVKKPLDMAELFESKLSALVASAAFVPIIAAQMAEHFSTADPQAPHAMISSGVHYASVLPMAGLGFDFRWLFVPLFLAAFLVVWMTGHAINVLIALCPFGFIDAGLKLVKAALLSSIVLSYVVHPYFGAAVSMAVILAAAWFAPAAFRLIVFGTVFAAETLLPSRGRRLATPKEAHAFAGRSAGVPTRTYGRMVRADDGSVHFSFRPWLIMPRRMVPLPEGALALSKGVYYPSLLHRPAGAAAFTRIVVFLPRYRTQEAAIAEYFEISDLRDSALKKGFKAVRQWIGEMTSAKPLSDTEAERIGAR